MLFLIILEVLGESYTETPSIFYSLPVEEVFGLVKIEVWYNHDSNIWMLKNSKSLIFVQKGCWVVSLDFYWRDPLINSL